MIFRRDGVCTMCSCRIRVERFESLAKVLKRLDEMSQCPNCGCAVRWRDVVLPREHVTTTHQVVLRRK